MKNSRKKYVEITDKTGSDEIYALLGEVESDVDEDVNNEMNDSEFQNDTEFLGNDEVDYNSGSAANASDILVLAGNVHSLSSANPSFDCSPILKKIHPSGGGNALTTQVKKHNVSYITGNILLHFSSDPRSFDVFETAVDLNKLISHIVAQKKIVCITE